MAIPVTDAPGTCDDGFAIGAPGTSRGQNANAVAAHLFVSVDRIFGNGFDVAAQ